MQFVIHGSSRVNVEFWCVSGYWAFLYVFESAFTFKSDYLVSASYFMPFSCVASGDLFVYFPQQFGFCKG